jgi:ATP-dependent DNA helicase RecQ
MSFQLTHRDVQLGYFEYVQQRLSGMVSGTSLFADPDGLAGPSGLVVKYSAAFNKRLLELFSKGYAFKSARANYIVFWVDTNSGKESKIVLPELVLGRG